MIDMTRLSACFVILSHALVFSHGEATNACCRVNSAVTVGSNATFSCCTAAKRDSILLFNYFSYIMGLSRIIYNGETLNDESQNHFEVIHDEFTMLPTLRLINATLNNSGEYECEDVTEGKQNNKGSYLSVIDPSCWLIENETLQLGCDVIFTGSVPPTINCSTQHSASVPNRTIVSFNESTTSTMMYRQDMESTMILNGTQISCNVYVDWSSMIDQSQRCINTSLSHVYTWTSRAIYPTPRDDETTGLDLFTLLTAAAAVFSLLLIIILAIILIIRHSHSKGSVRSDIADGPDVVRGTVADNSHNVRGGHVTSMSMPDVSATRIHHHHQQQMSRMHWASANDVTVNYHDGGPARSLVNYPEESFDDPYPREPTPPPVPRKMACIAEVDPETLALYADLDVVKLSKTRPLRRPPLQAVYAAIDHTVNSSST